MLPNDWDDALGDRFPTPGWDELMAYVERERSTTTVYPPADSVFRAFDLTAYRDSRVVILGQDPYHGEGEAHGLVFSVASGTVQLSLRRILQELERDPEVSPPQGANLEGWASQGVLLLNTALTVEKDRANSHRGRGWEAFTDSVISAVSDKTERVVFLLWGGAAQTKAKLIDQHIHTVITAAHPAARSNAKVPLVGSSAFSRANAALAEAGREPVDWSRSASSES